MRKLPEPYVDCVVLTTDGFYRIARLNHDKTAWQIASYCKRKCQGILLPEMVVDFKEIDFNL